MTHPPARRYTTIAELAGADVNNTGPVPVDGYPMWNAISTLGDR